MSEMIERVAKAIFRAWAEAEGAETTWDQLVDMQGLDGYANSKKHYKMAFDEARAAIEAMKAPTDSMMAAGRLIDIRALRSVDSIYNAMLEEALK